MIRSSFRKGLDMCRTCSTWTCVTFFGWKAVILDSSINNYNTTTLMNSQYKRYRSWTSGNQLMFTSNFRKETKCSQFLRSWLGCWRCCGLVWVFLTLLTSWDFHTEFTLVRKTKNIHWVAVLQIWNERGYSRMARLLEQTGSCRNSKKNTFKPQWREKQLRKHSTLNFEVDSLK